MLYVGGGAGMAPMRSHLYQLFKTIKTGRKVTFWYGGRSRRELFYIDHFRDLEKDFPNFKFYTALSEPMEEDNVKKLSLTIFSCTTRRIRSTVHERTYEGVFYLFNTNAKSRRR